LKVIRVGLLVCLLTFLVTPFFTISFAQTPQTGTISGTVSDASGAVLPGATITITGSAGMAHTATSSDRGTYEVKGLAAGTYSVKVVLDGFKDFEAKILQLADGQTLRADASMELAEIKANVEVQGQGITQVETESAQIAGSVTEKEVTSLTLNGRNFTQLAALAPGISNQTGQDEASVGIKGSVRYSVNGGRVEYNSFDVDGGDVLNALNASTTTLIVFPSPDSIEELQVLTSNYGAMYGRSASGTILATTKSGGSAFHGDLYFFGRDNIFNDRNFFDQTTHAPLYQKYNPGGTIGGPLYIPGIYNIKKDKTYFFFSEEYRHEKSPTDFNQAVPSLAERNCLNNPTTAPNYQQCLDGGGQPGSGSGKTVLGDFSDVCPIAGSGIINAFTKSLVEHQLNPGIPYAPDCPAFTLNDLDAATGIWIYNSFAGNLVPLSNFPIGNLIPPTFQQATTAPSLILNSGIIPNPTGNSGCNSFLLHPARAVGGSCYNQVVSPLTTWREELFRIDHNFNSKTKLSFRYIHDAWSTDALTPPYATVQNSFPTIQNDFVGPGLSLIAHLSNALSTKFYNDLAMSYAADHISLTNINGPGAMYQRPACLDGGPSCTPATSNIGYLFNNGFAGKVPGIVIGGTNFSYGGQGFAGDPAYMPWHHSNPTYSPRDDATLVLNKVTFTFGFLLIIAQRNEINPPVGANTGDLQGIVSFSNIGSPSSTGNAFADFLQGRIRSFQQDSGQLDYHNNYIVGEPYIQGDWHVTPRLTLNLGVRFSLFGTYHEKYSRAYNWDPALFSNALAGEVGTNFGDGSVSVNKVPVLADASNIDRHLLNGVVQCGTQGTPISCMKDKIFNPAPRIGFAWDPTGTGKTSIRGGYGIFYEHGVGNEANTGSLEGSPADAPSGVIDMTQFGPGSWPCIGEIGSNCGGRIPQQAYPLNVTSIPTKAVWPYVQQWSLSVQRELPWDMLASLAYVGSKGTHLTAALQANQLSPIPASENPFPAGVPLTVNTCSSFNSGSVQIIGPSGVVTTVSPASPAYVNLEAACYGTSTRFFYAFPDPNFLRSQYSGIGQIYPQILNTSGIGQIYSLQNIANSSYHALQFTLRRTKGPLTLGLSYSYSHSFDNSSDRTDPVVNAFALNQNRASSNFDERHLVNVDYIYQMPVEKIFNWVMTPITAKGATPAPGPFGPDSHAKWFKGWAISGITTFATGTPFSVINGGSANGTSYPDNAGVLTGNAVASYPDIVAPSAATPPLPKNSNTIGPLLGNPFQFAAPTGLTFGDAGRNSFNNPSRLNWDIALTKDFKTSDNTSLELRAETYNFFNHTQFEIFDRSRPGTQGNNVITCYAAPIGSTTTPTAGDSNCLSGNSFMHPIEAHQPRTVQFGVKFLF